MSYVLVCKDNNDKVSPFNKVFKSFAEANIVVDENIAKIRKKAKLLHIKRTGMYTGVFAEEGNWSFTVTSIPKEVYELSEGGSWL